VRARVVVLEVAQHRHRAIRLEVGGVVGIADQAAAVVAVLGEEAEEVAGDLAVTAGDEDIHPPGLPPQPAPMPPVTG
jgi:hypothetical protein